MEIRPDNTGGIGRYVEGSRAERRARDSLTYLLLSLAVAALALPFFWMVTTALKPIEEVTRYPPAWLPSRLEWRNFGDAWAAAPFSRFYVNSVVTGVSATALQIALAALMAYAFVFIDVPGRGPLFILVLATMMIPVEMRLAPNFVLVSRLGWNNTYWALIIPPAAAAFPVFVLKQRFEVLPMELIDAARIDGARHLGIMVNVVLPLSRAALAATALVTFAGRWNDYLWPLIVTSRAAMRTLPIGLAYLRDVEEGGGRWNLLMAGSIFVILPLLALYLVAQKQFVEGITSGAIKG